MHYSVIVVTKIGLKMHYVGVTDSDERYAVLSTDVLYYHWSVHTV